MQWGDAKRSSEWERFLQKGNKVELSEMLLFGLVLQAL